MGGSAALPVLLAAVLLAVAHRVDAAPAPITNLLLTSDYEVQSDGRFDRVTHMERRASNDAAAQAIAQFAFSYSPSIEKLEIVEAYTRKADGQILRVDPSAIRDQLPAGDRALLTFTDGRQKVIVFPQVAAGDTIVFTASQHVLHPRFPRLFAVSHLFYRTEDWDDVRISIQAPSTLPLQFDAVGAEVERSEAAGTIHYTWHFRASAASIEEPAAIAPIDELPRLIVTSAPDWDSIGHAYAAIAEPKAAVTPRVQALADEITAGVGDRRQQAERLYQWVSLHIRYVAIFLGNGAIEPHDADTVLANGYGDCKDHTVLFAALLRVKGIDSESVLINLGNSYQLTVPAPFPRLNHAISYLPEFGVYADTTARLARFGTLPFQEYGKPVILAVRSGPVLRQLPPLPPGAATTALTTTARFTADGRIIGDSTTEATGPFALSLRIAEQRVEAMGAEVGAAKQLRSFGEEGTGRFAFPATDLSAETVTASGHFDLDGGIHLTGGNILSLPSGLRLLIRPGDLLLGPLGLRGLPDSEPTPCYAGRQTEVLTLTLPADRHIERLPQGRKITNAAFEFTSHWSADGQTVTVRRELVSRIDQPLCAGQLRIDAAHALAEIRRDYGDRVILADQ